MKNPLLYDNNSFWVHSCCVNKMYFFTRTHLLRPVRFTACYICNLTYRNTSMTLDFITLTCSLTHEVDAELKIDSESKSGDSKTLCYYMLYKCALSFVHRIHNAASVPNNSYFPFQTTDPMCMQSPGTLRSQLWLK